MSDENKTTSQTGAPILTDAEHQQVHAQLHGKGRVRLSRTWTWTTTALLKRRNRLVASLNILQNKSTNTIAQAAPEEHDEGEEDNMEEIDEDNIISGGRRTRGKTIDFAKAAEGLDDDEDEDEDDDFEDPEEMKQ
ncbi:unnamed protein product [Aureobasidium pullulans]|nr:unnamed protein product [Aureobasidium pullulans]